MDPLLEETRPPAVTGPVELPAAVIPTTTRFGRWLLSELPAYRLGLLLGYAGMIYFGISALIAGVPAFDIAAPHWWLWVWAPALILSGPIGLFGVLKDTYTFWKIELVAAILQTGTLFIYSGTLLFLAYGEGNEQRAAVGAGFVCLTIPPLIRMVLLLVKVTSARQGKRGTSHAGS